VMGGIYDSWRLRKVVKAVTGFQTRRTTMQNAGRMLRSGANQSKREGSTDRYGCIR
jgi:hypothetical protein